MSVRNICFSADEIRIYSDTMIYDGNKPAGFVERKVWTTDRFAVAGRGALPLVEAFQKWLLTFDDFDAAERAMIEQIEAPVASNAEIAMAGWSDRRGALAVVEFWVRAGERPRVVELTHGVTLAPRAGTVELPPFLDHAVMVKLAMAQHAVSLKHDLKCCIGGRLDVTTVRRDGVTQDVAGHYPAALAVAA